MNLRHVDSLLRIAILLFAIRSTGILDIDLDLLQMYRDQCYLQLGLIWSNFELHIRQVLFS